MIIGGNRGEVIDNIRRAAESGAFYAKVETDDPVLSAAESRAVIDRYLAGRQTRAYRMKARVARQLANTVTGQINKTTLIRGEKRLPDLSRGAIITSNHFGPLENTVIRKLVMKHGCRRLNIVSQVTNLAMTGPIGFLMNYADTVPIWEDAHYLKREFSATLTSLLNSGEVVLIYPEQEMWFNYRKPRPPKRGAYYYAAKLGVPVVSCFVEMIDLPEMDTEEFHKVRYVLHVLETLYPDPEKTVKENSYALCQRDYALKKAAYEKAYGKPLDYRFEDSDIAGWVGHRHEH